MATIISSCSFCSKAATTTCTGCVSIRYCSRNCQDQDAALHLLICKPFANFDLTTRPDTDHYLGILFPVSIPGPGLIKVDPQFVWIKDTDTAKVAELIGGEPNSPSRRTRQRIENEENYSVEAVVVWNQGNFKSRQNRRNPIVNKIVSQNYWRGAVLIMIGPFVEVKEPTQFRDFEVGDMKYVRMALEDFHREGSPNDVA
ncbi:GMP synthase [Venturia nashicola]|uniref:GMP synthase n=1 Tax=Venturia nashicola TaxID=86259 RepID=A0A4Z1PEK0_9PEZI|nr:GMP synthase [Venturia nashicola]TLD38021.1 GMP synthase [Venturia nashicola]